MKKYYNKIKRKIFENLRERLSELILRFERELSD